MNWPKNAQWQTRQKETKNAMEDTNEKDKRQTISQKQKEGRTEERKRKGRIAEHVFWCWQPKGMLSDERSEFQTNENE